MRETHIPRGIWYICHIPFPPRGISNNVHVHGHGHVLLVTRWLIFCSACKSWQSMMVFHRAVDQLNSWDAWVSISKLINCSMGYHNGLSGLICRTFRQPPSYKETSSFQFNMIRSCNECMPVPSRSFWDDTNKPASDNYLSCRQYFPYGEPIGFFA